MKKTAIIISLLTCLLYANDSLAQSNGIFISTKGNGRGLILNSDGSFAYGYECGICNIGTYKLKDKKHIILKFRNHTSIEDYFSGGYLDGIELEAKIINKNTIECNGEKLRRHPKHPTRLMRDVFKGFKPIFRNFHKKDSI